MSPTAQTEARLQADDSPMVITQVDHTVRGCLSGPFQGGGPVTSPLRYKATAVAGLWNSAGLRSQMLQLLLVYLHANQIINFHIISTQPESIYFSFTFIWCCRSFWTGKDCQSCVFLVLPDFRPGSVRYLHWYNLLIHFAIQRFLADKLVKHSKIVSIVSISRTLASF